MVLGRYINYVIHRLYCIHYLIPCMLSATKMAVDGSYRNFISFKYGSYLEYFWRRKIYPYMHCHGTILLEITLCWDYFRKNIIVVMSLFLSDRINKMRSQPNHPSLVDRVWWFSRRFFTPTSNFSRLSHAQCSIWKNLSFF